MILMIGYGNSLRGDDGVGYLISEYLRQSVTNPDVEILSEHQLTPELVEPISCADLVIFIDAREGGAAGEISDCRVEPAAEGSRFTHQMHPAGLLAASQELYGRYPEAVLFSICGESFDYGETLSSAVRNAVPVVIDRIWHMIEARMVSYA